jgi:hypothetical protein
MGGEVAAWKADPAVEVSHFHAWHASRRKRLCPAFTHMN